MTSVVTLSIATEIGTKVDLKWLKDESKRLHTIEEYICVRLPVEYLFHRFCQTRTSFSSRRKVDYADIELLMLEGDRARYSYQ